MRLLRPISHQCHHVAAEQHHADRPDAVFTVRTYATTRDYESRLAFGHDVEVAFRGLRRFGKATAKNSNILLISSG